MYEFVVLFGETLVYWTMCMYVCVCRICGDGVLVAGVFAMCCGLLVRH
jgi:hypothetical protein